MGKQVDGGKDTDGVVTRLVRLVRGTVTLPAQPRTPGEWREKESCLPSVFVDWEAWDAGRVMPHAPS